MTRRPAPETSRGQKIYTLGFGIAWIVGSGAALWWASQTGDAALAVGAFIVGLAALFVGVVSSLAAVRALRSPPGQR
jgi:uncharacterized membrane protein